VGSEAREGRGGGACLKLNSNIQIFKHLETVCFLKEGFAGEFIQACERQMIQTFERPAIQTFEKRISGSCVGQ
jgi:hypothetical protein